MRSSTSSPMRRRLPRRRGADQGHDAADRRRGGDAALRPYGAGARDQRRLGRQHRGGRRGAGRHAPASSARSRPTSSANSTATISPPPASSSPPPAADFGVPTARSMVLVTPDGAPDDEHLPRRRPASARRRRSTRRRSRDAAILYLEGYLWDPETPRYAMIKAIDIARARRPQGRLHPLRQLLHRPPPRRLQPADRRAARSTSCSPTKPRSRRWPASPDFDERGGGGRRHGCATLVVTRSEKGAIAVQGGERAEVAAEPVGAGGRHDRRRRSVRRRLPRRPGPGPRPRRIAADRRDRRRRGDLRITAPGPRRTSRRWSPRLG